MSYRSSLVLIPALSFVLSMSAMADITLNNGADINMSGSPGSTIIFPDGTIQSTATVADPAGADGSDGAPGSDGADGADGADGSDAAVPAGHGGTGNIVSGTDSFVGGGYVNIASHDYATVAGGAINAASDDRATVGGGVGNTASGYGSTVGGGENNGASGDSSTVAGGAANTASNYGSTVAGGNGNMASGSRSTVAGGGGNRAAGDYSFAAGYRAKIDALHDGTFIFADSTPADFNSAAADEFAVRANGGVRFITNSAATPDAGVGLGSGDTSWNVLSAKDSKENYTHVDAVHILEQVVELPIERWNYRHQDDSVKHIGPYAEDFHAAFGLHGESNRTISSQDLDGVALAAIQGLNLKLEAKQTEIDSLREQFASLEQRLLAMEASMN